MSNTILAKLKKEYPNAKFYLNADTPLQLLVATILSAQTRDDVVNGTTPDLFKKYKTAHDFANASEEELYKHISVITYAGNKAKFIKKACQMLIDDYSGEVPDELDKLVKLPGVGRKTANAILMNGFGKVVGIPCDTHVIRVSFRLGFTKEKNPDKIEKDLMKLVPQKDWNKIPYIMKDHGRALCTAPIPKCSKCFLDKVCPKKGVTKST